MITLARRSLTPFYCRICCDSFPFCCAPLCGHSLREGLLLRAACFYIPAHPSSGSRDTREVATCSKFHASGARTDGRTVGRAGDAYLPCDTSSRRQIGVKSLMHAIRGIADLAQCRVLSLLDCCVHEPRALGVKRPRNRVIQIASLLGASLCVSSETNVRSPGSRRFSLPNIAPRHLSPKELIGLAFMGLSLYLSNQLTYTIDRDCLERGNFLMDKKIQSDLKGPNWT